MKSSVCIHSFPTVGIYDYRPFKHTTVDIKGAAIALNLRNHTAQHVTPEKMQNSRLQAETYE